MDGTTWMKSHRRILGLAAVVALGTAVAARADEISCEPPAVADVDSDGSAYCAQPNVSCYEDAAPAYAGNGEWICPSIEEVMAAKSYEEGPQISCPEGAVFWDAENGEWACEDLTECEICKRCFSYVQLAKERCIDKSRRVARAKCDGTYGSTWRGERVDADGRTCETKTFQDETTGKIHKLETNCTGPAIDDCVNGWEESHPGEATGSSSTSSVSYKVGAKGGGKLFGIGVEVSGERGTQDTEGKTFTVSWGGGKGYLNACNEGADQVAALCSDCTEACSNDE